MERVTGVAQIRVNEHGIEERVPQDAWNPDGWREVTANMERRARELGLARLEGS